MQKTKVLFVMLQLDAGGSERVVLDLARNLDPFRYEIYIATFKGGILETPLKVACKEIFFIEKKAGFDIFAMKALAEYVRKYEIDVVNAHHYMPCFYSFYSVLGSKKKLIYTEHSVPEVEDVAYCFHGKIFYWMLFRMYAVIGVSTEITLKFKSLYPRHADKFISVLNGVDIERYSAAGNRDQGRIRLGLSANHFVVGTVANFRKVKNHVCLVRAVARLKDAYPQLRVVFVGTGFPGDTENSEPEVRGLIEKLRLQDTIHLIGYQENVPELLSAFDVFCLPSISEGLPVSVLEAMAAGIPVIGSQVSGINEVINNRETGLLFIPDDDADLARVLEELMKSCKLSETLAKQAFKDVVKKHSKKSWVEKTSDIFARPGL